MYFHIHYYIGTNFWSLDTAGDKHFEELKMEAKLAKLIIMIITIFALATAFLALPWFGDEYDFYITVKFCVDNLGKWSNLMLTIFYFSFFHIAMIIVSNIFLLLYLLLHLKFQFFLLNRGLEGIKDDDEKKLDVILDPIYQEMVRRKLVICLKHHQKLE
jgi:hypothetical protein